MLLSVDSEGLGCLWDIDTGDCMYEFSFSEKTPVQVEQYPGTNHFIAVEIDSDRSNYKLSVWRLERATMVLEASLEEFSDHQFKSICTLIPEFSAKSPEKD